MLAGRLQPDGGPIIGVQLDNEIGMLAWVSNSPVLNPRVAADFADWLQRPPRSSGPVVAEDLMRFCRHDFRRYVDTLTGFARARGITGVPLLINIHGTGGGRGLTYPIGISQLLGTWRNRWLTRSTAGIPVPSTSGQGRAAPSSWPATTRPTCPPTPRCWVASGSARDGVRMPATRVW